MFLHEVGADDPRFKSLTFHEGMNIVVAESTQRSAKTDSRNGAGKTSLALILRYLLGGDMKKENPLKVDALEKFNFSATFTLPDGACRMSRPMKPTTQVMVEGKKLYFKEWRKLVGTAYGLDEDISHPTVGQLVSQTVRTDFSDPVKIEQHQSNYEAGIRLGYFLGLSPNKLNMVRSISELEKNRKNLRTAINKGAMPGVSLDEGSIRSTLIRARAQKERISEKLEHFRVDEQYQEHQNKADDLSRGIRDLNEEMLTLKRREGDLKEATQITSDEESSFENDIKRQVAQLYKEMEIELPDSTLKRYDDVLAFHKSVVRNRRMFLESELRSVTEQLDEDKRKIDSLDIERAEIMEILQASMALDSFQKAQQDISELDSRINTLEQQLDLAQKLSSNKRERDKKAAQAQSELHDDLNFPENAKLRDTAIYLFSKLGNEIYHDREANLTIEEAGNGELSVKPSITGDASAGIGQVEIFLLDMVFLTTAMKLGRSPKFIFHDSRLFDSMDSRQISSCLNIGARLADEMGFQYVVTINSDTLKQADGFEFREEYKVEPTLKDFGEDGGLFGFRF